MATIKVFGHKVPDTDSVCSAIVFAWYLTEKKSTPATAYIAGKPNKETAYALKKLKVKTPELIESVEEGDKVVIVDSTNPEELIGNLEEAEVLEVIDHHKLGGLKTSTPLKATIRPLGCSSTVIWEVLKADGVNELPKEVASLMLTAILSDTLKLTSPTATENDKQAVAELQKMTDLNVDEYAEELFAAKSDLTGMGAKDVLLADAKEFDLKGKKVLIGVHETTKPGNALKMKTELISEMNKVMAEKKYDGVFFFIVDILNAYAEAITASPFEKGVVEKAFSVEVKDNQVKLPGIVSRKKQIVPNLEKAL